MVVKAKGYYYIFNNENLDFEEMTKPMLNELIDKIVVHQCDKSTGKRIQKVEVYYRFIGLIE